METEMDWLKEAIDYGVMGLLLLMSVMAVAVAVERYLTYRALRLDDYKDRRELEMALTSRLHLIATIGSNAPYVGLLGTVLGIMLTFQSMGQEGFMESARIMSGLSMALKATAAGLLVAIPCVVMYNLLLRKVRVLVLRWEVDNARQGI
jgi:biopolymer transport protein ExbB